MLSPTSNPPPHIQIWLPHLQPYNYIIQCIPGNLNHADYLCRKVASIDNLDSNLQCSEQYINIIASNGTPKSVTLDNIKHHTNKDPLLKSVIPSIKTNRWNKKNIFYKVRNEWSITDNIVLWANEIVIPSTLQHNILETVHAQHQGSLRRKPCSEKKFGGPESPR